MLLLKEGFSPDKKTLFETLRHRYKKPDGTEPLVTISAPDGTDALVNFSGVHVAILRRDTPLPDEFRDMTAPARTPHWPGAAEICAGHRAHLIFGLIGPQPHKTIGARVLTAVAGAVAALYPGQVLAGLYGAEILNAGAAWAELSASAFAASDNVPVCLWVSLLPFADARTGGAGVLTRGLVRFVDRELELVAPLPDLQNLLARAHGLSAYLVQNGPVLQDGHTFGISATERISVRLQTSERFAGLPVIAAALSAI